MEGTEGKGQERRQEETLDVVAWQGHCGPSGSSLGQAERPESRGL